MRMKYVFYASQRVSRCSSSICGNCLDPTVLSKQQCYKCTPFMPCCDILQEFCKSNLMRSKLSFRRNLCIFCDGTKKILISCGNQVITTDIRNKTELTLRMTGLDNVSLCIFIKCVCFYVCRLTYVYI